MDSALPPESLSLHSIAGISSRPEGSWVRSQQGSETGGSNGPSPAGSSESASAAYNSGLSSFTNISSNSNGSTVPEAHAIPEQSPTSTMQDLFTNPMNAPTGLSSQSAEQAPDLPEGEIDFTTFLSSTSMSLDATTYETLLPEVLDTNLHRMDWTSTPFFDNSVIYG